MAFYPMVSNAQRIILADHARLPRRFFGRLVGLFLLRALTAVFVLAAGGMAAAQPLAIEVVDAQVAYAQWTSEPVISFRMSPASAKAFAQLTLANVGRKFALRVDGQTLSEPVIREPITGGSGQISGHFTADQARDIAAKLLSGKSKLEMEIVN
jgi:preprotein translocase subunit SecD